MSESSNDTPPPYRREPTGEHDVMISILTEMRAGRKESAEHRRNTDLLLNKILDEQRSTAVRLENHSGRIATQERVSTARSGHTTNWILVAIISAATSVIGGSIASGVVRMAAANLPAEPAHLNQHAP